MANTTAATSNPLELSKASISVCTGSLSHKILESDADNSRFPQLIIRFCDIKFSWVVAEATETPCLIVLIP